MTVSSRLVLLITSRHRPHRKHPSQQLFYCCVTQLSHGPRSECRFLLSPLMRVRNLLPNNGHCLQSHYLATGLHATIFLSSTTYETVSTKIRRLMLIYMVLNSALTSTGRMNADDSGRMKKEIVLSCFKVQQQHLLWGTEEHSKNPHYRCWDFDRGYWIACVCFWNA
jgi:hypothetical protein